MSNFLYIAGLVVALAIAVFVVFRLVHRYAPNPVHTTVAPGDFIKVHRSQLVFSLATIKESLPPLDAAARRCPLADYLMFEDDWAQIEFVAPQDAEYLAKLVADVRQFKVDNWTGEAWRQLFVRPEHPTPLHSVGICWDDIRTAIGLPAHEVFIFHSATDPDGSAHRVTGGFSFRIRRRCVVYGHQSSGVIASLAADLFIDGEEDICAVSECLKAIGRLSPLFLVDWNTTALLELSDHREVRRWLEYLGDPK